LEELDTVVEEKTIITRVTAAVLPQTVRHSVQLHRHVTFLARVDMAAAQMAGADGAAVAVAVATSEDKAAAAGLAMEPLMDPEAKEEQATRLLVLLSLAHPPAAVLEDMAMQARMVL
jgi:hypothetical protein